MSLDWLLRRRESLFYLFFILTFVNRFFFDWQSFPEDLRSPNWFFQIFSLSLFLRNLEALQIAWLIFGVLCILDFWRGPSRFIFLFLTTATFSIQNSFGPPFRHEYLPYLFLLVVTFVPRDRGAAKPYYWLGRMTWVLMFFGAGISKLINSGWAWTRAENLTYFLALENAKRSAFSEAHAYILETFCGAPMLLTWSLTLILLMELSYPLALCAKRAAIFYLSLSLFVQLAVMFFMNIRFYEHWLGIVFWLPILFSPKGKSTYS